MSMLENQLAERRPRGRPQVRCDDDTRHLIVEAAAQEFQANGYAATNMGAVAQRAGVSTKTLYRLVPTKADLFASVVEDRIRRFMLATDDEIIGGQDLAAGLERILVAFGSLTLSAEVISINRLVIGESERFPEIARTFYLSAIVPVNTMIEGWLQRQVDQGRLRIDDIHIASGILRGMMLEPQRVAMLRQRKAPDAAEISSRARICARLFLDGCRI
ncbi:MAG: TetR/AcrR family transcriptional regulator [Geminicoccaceae bacterium]